MVLTWHGYMCVREGVIVGKAVDGKNYCDLSFVKKKSLLSHLSWMILLTYRLSTVVFYSMHTIHKCYKYNTYVHDLDTLNLCLPKV